jgi:hypothetical protein
MIFSLILYSRNNLLPSPLNLFTGEESLGVSLHSESRGSGSERNTQEASQVFPA